MNNNEELELKKEVNNLRRLLERSYEYSLDLKNSTGILMEEYRNAVDKVNKLELTISKVNNEINNINIKNKKQQEEIVKLKEKNQILTTRLEAMRNSKLGRINRQYWILRKRFEEK